MIRRLITEMDDRLLSLESAAEYPSKSVQIRNIHNLQNCLKTSVDVVSSASTMLDMSDTFSARAPSDNVDLLPPIRNEVTQQWIKNVCHANEFANQSSLCGSVIDDLDVMEISDSEAEFEAEVLQMQLQKRKEELKNGDSKTTERWLKKGIPRLRQHKSRHLDTFQKLGMLQELLETFEHQKMWDCVKNIKMERINVLSDDMVAEPNLCLKETLELVELLIKLGDQSEARIYARKCVKSYTKLGLDGIPGLRRALELMITACSLDGDKTDEETYETLLRNLPGSELGCALTCSPHLLLQDEKGKQRNLDSSSFVRGEYYPKGTLSEISISSKSHSVAGQSNGIVIDHHIVDSVRYTELQSVPLLTGPSFHYPKEQGERYDTELSTMDGPIHTFQDNPNGGDDTDPSPESTASTPVLNEDTIPLRDDVSMTAAVDRKGARSEDTGVFLTQNPGPSQLVILETSQTISHEVNIGNPTIINSS
jgi:hypothetical protein